MTALEAIRIYGPISIVELARRVGTDIPGAERRVIALGRDGLVVEVGGLGGYGARPGERLYDVTGRGGRVFALRRERQKYRAWRLRTLARKGAA